MTTQPRAAHHRLIATLRNIMRGDAGAGLLLISVATLAMAMANSPLAPEWHAFWHGALGLAPTRLLATPEDWINEGLMAVFFFAVGLEIKREALVGALAHRGTRVLPVLAAAAGMAVPAMVYLAFVHGSAGLSRGFAIPAATDIAFAMGVLALVGRGLPPSLRLFLLSIAVVDDLGAVVIIAAAYTPAVAWGWLAAGGAVWLAMLAAGHWGARVAPLMIVLAVLLWVCVLASGVHASVAGVAGALAIPLAPGRRGRSLLLRMEHILAPWSAYGIVPLFALANAGVPLHAASGGQAAVLGLAVAMGLLIGKQMGILGAVWLATKTRLAPRPAGASLTQLWGVSLLAGIGFTMSLFLTALAFAGSAIADAARLGIFAGSLVSGLTGWIVLRRAR